MTNDQMTSTCFTQLARQIRQFGTAIVEDSQAEFSSKWSGGVSCTPDIGTVDLFNRRMTQHHRKLGCAQFSFHREARIFQTPNFFCVADEDDNKRLLRDCGRNTLNDYHEQ